MIFHYYRQARALRALRRDLAYYKDAYANAIEALNKMKRDVAALIDEPPASASQPHTLQTALLALDAANEREADLRRLLAEAQEYANGVELERDDARREVDEVRAALVWLEKDFKVTGSEA